MQGVCCSAVRSVARMTCNDNASAYGFVLGGRSSTFGLWYEPTTWDCMAVGAGTRWGNWSAEFDPTLASIIKPT